ncbi:hypothetical protein MSAN_01316000 [Mycena sanguinolenta]|uniref:Uncharacterized protein n=1 Tax=Mycena sanguinolenta TaxID=230812 RepID=A0A8H6YEG8_9AGAR|nr:hypothetical protein MSAN_01316000 [Mycena sanguinolenta]
MTRLEHLHLWIPTYDDAVYNSFASLNFPALRRFGCHQPRGCADHQLVAFLDHHPALTHLEIIPPYRDVDHQSESSCLFHLHIPALREYRGSATYFLRITISGRCLEQASFWDVPPKADLPEQLFQALASTTTICRPFSLTFLWDGFFWDRFQAATLALLAKHLPNLRSLKIAPFNLPVRPLNLAAVTTIVEMLAALKHISEFHHDNPADGVLDQDKQDANNDRLAVTQWGDRCPTLISIQLHNQTWLRGRDGKFAPAAAALV